ncbi:ABC transporter permease, partial [Enterococcus faecium]
VIGYFNPLTYQLYAIRSIVFATPANSLLIIVLVFLATLIMISISSFAVSKMSLVLTER